VIDHVRGGVAMKLPQAGDCQCGKIRCEITEEPKSVYTCHCTACQRLTSSAFSLGLVVAEKAFKMSGVEPRPLQRLADSGRMNTRLGRPECPRDRVEATATLPFLGGDADPHRFLRTHGNV